MHVIPMWLRSTSTVFRALLLVCALPFLSGCPIRLILFPIVDFNENNVDCEALRSDRERGVVYVRRNQSQCAALNQSGLRILR